MYNSQGNRENGRIKLSCLYKRKLKRRNKGIKETHKEQRDN